MERKKETGTWEMKYEEENSGAAGSSEGGRILVRALIHSEQFLRLRTSIIIRQSSKENKCVCSSLCPISSSVWIRRK